MIQAPRRPNAIVASLSIALFAYALQQTAVFPMIPSIQHDLHTSGTWVSWVVSGYLLVGVVASPLGGKLGDQYGRKRVLVAGMSFFLLGSLGAMLAPSIGVLIAMRTVQALGAVTIPLAASLVGDSLPKERVSRAVGVIFATMSIGMALGSALGGVVTDLISWRGSFAIPAVMVGAALVMIVRYVPESDTRAETQRDYPGAVLLATGLTSLLLALTQAERWHWLSGKTLGLFGAAAALLFVWGVVELRVPEPLLDLRLLRRRPILLTNVCSCAFGFAVFGPLNLIPRLVESSGNGYGFADSPARAGLYLTPGLVAALFAIPIVERLGRRHGPRIPLATSAAIFAVGCLLLAELHSSPWEILGASFLIGSSWPAGSAALTNLVLAHVQPTEAGVTTGMMQAIRWIGSVLGTQIGATVLASDRLPRSVIPRESAFTTMFFACAAAAVVAMVLALLVEPRRRGSLEPAIAPLA